MLIHAVPSPPAARSGLRAVYRPAEDVVSAFAPGI